MSIDQNTSGTSDGTVGDLAGEQAKSASTQTDDSSNSERQVPWSKSPEYRDLRKDMLKYKDKMIEAQESLSKRDDEALREKQDYKTLYERSQEHANESEKKYTSLKGNVFSNEKHNAVLMAALKSGLRPEAEQDLGLLTLDGVQVEATTEGRFLVHGADEFVRDLKKTKGYWFKDENVPMINSGGTGKKSAELPNEITAEIILELERKKNLGDKEAELQYNDLMPKFAEANRRRKLGL